MSGEKEKNYKRGVAVYACLSDVLHPVVLEMAKKSGILSKEGYDKFMAGGSQGLPESDISVILENFFGFEKGNFETHIIEGIQLSRTGQVVVGEARYIGEERTDKEWVESGLASRGAIEMYRYGGLLTIGEK